MDIEGGEFVVLPNMYDYLKSNRPTMLLELHLTYLGNDTRKIKAMQKVLKLYDWIYNDKHENIGTDSVISSLRNEKEKTFRIVLTSST